MSGLKTHFKQVRTVRSIKTFSRIDEVYAFQEIFVFSDAQLQMNIKQRATKVYQFHIKISLPILEKFEKASKILF